MAMANLVIEDPSLRDMLYQFVKDYTEAQQPLKSPMSRAPPPLN
ncbi:MAG: hypothetical protein ACJAYO_001770 [Thalassolituus oleivorans]|jgi:hypothetical protein